MMSRQALCGARIFTGEQFLNDHAVIIDDGSIVGVAKRAEVGEDIEIIDLGGGVLAPGFVDAQVNGGGGFLFNGSPDVATITGICAAHGRYGSTALLPTFITARTDEIWQALRAAREAWVASVPGMAGIHVEGPYLSRARKGAHDPALIRPLTDADVDMILDSGIETVLLTVAAENAEPRLIRRLTDGGVIVAIGHSDATYEMAMAAAEAGARGITHLFNAMSQLQGRAPGVVAAALDNGALWCGLIADGFHVHPVSLTLAIRAKRGPGRTFLVTDAMPTAGDDDDVFYLGDRKVTRRNGKLTLADGTLAGSDLTMDQAVRFAVDNLDVSLGEALRMASLYPAQFLRLDDRRGRIARGYRADLVHLSDALQTRSIWIGGEPYPGHAA